MFDDPQARLDPLRGELGQIDREILALVATRYSGPTPSCSADAT